MEKLFLFSPSELQMILCGDQAPQWTQEDIINYTEPKLGYTKDRLIMFYSHLIISTFQSLLISDRYLLIIKAVFM